MKSPLLLFVPAAFFLWSSCTGQVNLNKWKEGADKVLKQTTGDAGLTEEDIISGLKEALKVGSENAGAKGSQVDGFFKNPLIFIPFPPEVQKVADKLRELGMQEQVDKFVETLNRGAEEACKKAAPIFVDAVMKMTFRDARNILAGSDTAATQYLRQTTSAQLFTAFRPVIDAALNSVGATQHWETLVNIYNKIPFVEKVNPDLGAYTTHRAIKGLFFLVGQEETKIRKDPAAQVTELLKKVFGR